MYSIGDYVVYGDSDVCRVVGVGVPEMYRHREASGAFYFLETQFCKGMIYAPVGTRMPIRPVIGREEALRLIEEMPSLKSDICPASDKKKLTDHYETLLGEHTCRSLAVTAKSIYEKYHAAGAKGRLPNLTESAYYKKTSELLFQELSVALGESVDAGQARMAAVCFPGGGMKWTL